MKISLITTVKNEAPTAQRLIQAIRRQTRLPDEWIVVDGGSDDGTAELFRQEPLCRVLGTSGNIAEGRNAAIDRAMYPIIAVIDAGCEPIPHWLEWLTAPLEQGKAEIAAGATTPRIGSSLEAAQWTLCDQFVLPWPGMRQPAISSRSLAFRRTVWLDDPYPEWLPYGEDTWIIERWRSRGHTVIRVPQAAVIWNLRPTVRAFLIQHFRYMYGDGRGRLHTGRHLLRFGFYGMIGSCVSIVGGSWVWIGLSGWAAYFLLTASRLLLIGPERTLRLCFTTLLRLPPMLIGLDLVKMVGYLTGQGSRWTRPPLSS